jgi:heterogeneous nuclear ribonucleoprotein A1/A3
VILPLLVKEEIAEEEDDEENSPTSIQSIIEAFPKDQLVELLRDAAMAHPSVLDQVRQAADVDPAQRKVFVHGLGWDTTNEVLTSTFSPFGEIEDLKVEF